jgi:hypothetical protein
MFLLTQEEVVRQLGVRDRLNVSFRRRDKLAC